MPSEVTLTSNRARRKVRRVGTTARTYVDAFFAQYPDFAYDPNAPIMAQFWAMCDLYDWKRRDKKRDQAHDELKSALVQQFNTAYGTDANDIELWKNLCLILGIDPIPTKLHHCRSAVRNTYVNLVDLVDIGTIGGEVDVFPSEVALSNYTKETGKFFPMNNVLAGSLLRYLLRRITNPRSDAIAGISRQGRGKDRRHR